LQIANPLNVNQAPQPIDLTMQDEVIQRFEDRCTEANAEIQQLREAMQETSKRLEAADNRLASTMESRNKLRRQLDAKQAEMTTAHASLQADNEVLKVCSAAHVQTICFLCPRLAISPWICLLTVHTLT